MTPVLFSLNQKITSPQRKHGAHIFWRKKTNVLYFYFADLNYDSIKNSSDTFAPLLLQLKLSILNLFPSLPLLFFHFLKVFQLFPGILGSKSKNFKGLVITNYFLILSKLYLTILFSALISVNCIKILILTNNRDFQFYFLLIYRFINL